MNKSTELDGLVASIEALLERLPDSVDPVITQLRDRVDETIFDTWTATARQSVQTRNVEEVVESIDTFFTRYPLVACGAAVMIAGSASYIVGRSIRSQAAR